jgi:hypothetical protein
MSFAVTEVGFSDHPITRDHRITRSPDSGVSDVPIPRSRYPLPWYPTASQIGVTLSQPVPGSFATFPVKMVFAFAVGFGRLLNARHFSFLGEARPFCILEQNDSANKARNRPCSISRAERKAYRPKFFGTFRQYTCPS